MTVKREIDPAALYSLDLALFCANERYTPSAVFRTDHVIEAEHTLNASHQTPAVPTRLADRNVKARATGQLENANAYLETYETVGCWSVPPSESFEITEASGSRRRGPMSSDDAPVPKLGGLGEVKETTDEVRDILEQVRAGCEEKAGKKFEVFEPVHFRTQMVNGINFFIKAQPDEAVGQMRWQHLDVLSSAPYPVNAVDSTVVKIADDDFIHVRAHKARDDKVSLWGIQEGKKAGCAVVHFD
ncbi:stefin-C-like [Tropilaelaps mercedesae]|uniref:Stefin-C-like n=1 Tax=Tropilaelaps mercedesae TaxID=418985 RepID=A0A1V9Y103_9ACAR|nr:stefin-C-like [Tropilaelaps mercedesae]